MKSLFNLFGVLLLALAVSACSDPVSIDTPSDEAALGKKDQAAGQQTQSIAAIAGGNPDFSILVDALGRLGLVEKFTTEGQFTVFAPTNDAFAAFLVEFSFDSLGAIPLPLLEAVVTYHVIEGRQFSKSVLKKKQFETLQGEYLYLQERGKTTLVDANGRTSTIVTEPTPLFDIPATNGVIHAINTVIAPDLGS